MGHVIGEGHREILNCLRFKLAPAVAPINPCRSGSIRVMDIVSGECRDRGVEETEGILHCICGDQTGEGEGSLIYSIFSAVSGLCYTV